MTLEAVATRPWARTSTAPQAFTFPCACKLMSLSLDLSLFLGSRLESILGVTQVCVHALGLGS